MPGFPDGRLAAARGVVVVAGGLLPRRFHAAAGSGRGRLAEPARRLHAAVPRGPANAAGGGGESAAPGGAGGALGGAAHLGPGSALPPALARHRDRRRSGLRCGWYVDGAAALGRVPTGVLLA